jgi:1,5-anhydro-D-fructose reductase (1,5-anhydro-D-mannitol-forming)
MVLHASGRADRDPLASSKAKRGVPSPSPHARPAETDKVCHGHARPGLDHVDPMGAFKVWFVPNQQLTLLARSINDDSSDLERARLGRGGMPMKWGLIGASTIASEYVIHAIRAQGHEIVGVLSGDAARGADYAGRHGIPASTTDLEELLSTDGLDAVYVSTTNEKHHPQTLAAIAAGKHVLCEKPLAMTLGEAAEMVRSAADAGVVLATNHHLRSAGSHEAVRALIASGRIGRVLSVRVFHAVQLPAHLQGWRINDPAAGGGVIPDITVHDADTVRFYLDEDPVEVVAMAGASGLGQGVEDSVMSVWTMPSGTMVLAHESFTHPFAGSGVEVHGTEGSIFGRGIMTQKPVGALELVDASGRTSIPFDTHDLYTCTLGRFAEAVGGRGRPSADGVDGLKSLAVALSVRDAARTGRAVRVGYEGF